MRAKGFNVGGEQSGHIILSDFTTTGDGLVAALQLLAVVKAAGPAGLGDLPALRQGAAAARQRALQVGQAARAQAGACRSIAESRDRLGKDGRLVIRESKTRLNIRRGRIIQTWTCTTVYRRPT